MDKIQRAAHVGAAPRSVLAAAPRLIAVPSGPQFLLQFWQTFGARDRRQAAVFTHDEAADSAVCVIANVGIAAVIVQGHVGGEGARGFLATAHRGGYRLTQREVAIHR